jgi:hypothetical protein
MAPSIAKTVGVLAPTEFGKAKAMVANKHAISVLTFCTSRRAQYNLDVNGCTRGGKSLLSKNVSPYLTRQSIADEAILWKCNIDGTSQIPHQ